MSPHRPRKRFGQHFLRDPGAIDAIVRAIAPAPGDTIVEIGPGDAALTRPLARRVETLHAIELDRDLARRLRDEFGGQENVTIHEADALTFDYATLGDSLRIVGNLPYNISTPLLFALVDYRARIVDMHFMLQKEVVDRMAAGPGSKAYGRLGIMLGCHFEVEPLFDVERLAFDPPPEVTSSVVRLRPHAAGTFDIKDEARLSRLVAQAFSQRRKTIRNALRNTVDEATLESVGIDPGLRPEAVPIASYVRLANTLE
jgi:16S rRNA (adenine1518-N6/adenine1519-N6)-dimethyltransferase